MEQKIRQRNYNTSSIFKREEDEEEYNGVFRGYSISFNEWSVDLGGFKEMILPSAWDSADTSECLAVFNHREDNLLGSAKAKTLRFFPDSKGVLTEVDMADTTVSKNCAEWVKRGDIDTQSFKFTVEEDEWIFDEKEQIYRCTITKLGKIYDTSLVTRAAYPEGTSVENRGVDLEEVKKRLSPVIETKEEEDSNEISEEEIQRRNSIVSYYKNKLNRIV